MSDDAPALPRLTGERVRRQRARPAAGVAARARIAEAQVRATEAVAAAIDRLAIAVEAIADQ